MHIVTVEKKTDQDNPGTVFEVLLMHASPTPESYVAASFGKNTHMVSIFQVNESCIGIIASTKGH
jgi:hypothetical protein